MKKYIESLNLIDLISEKHKILRIKVLEKYEEINILKLPEKSNYLISILSMGELSISESARQVNISRQAVHKFSKELHVMGLIDIKQVENNKRDKFLSLTEKGKELFEELNSIKLEFEKEIESLIGSEKVLLLKQLLKEIEIES